MEADCRSLLQRFSKKNANPPATPASELDTARLDTALDTARTALLAERVAEGYWEGEPPAVPSPLPSPVLPATCANSHRH